MKLQHQTFIEAYLQTGDRLQAYAAAYPASEGEAQRTAANRLYRKHKAHIERLEAIANERVDKKLSKLADKRIAKEKATMNEKRVLLAQLMRGEWKQTRSLRVNNKLEQVTDDISPFALLRAIELDTKIEMGLLKPKQLAEKPKPKISKQEQEMSRKVKGFVINMPGINKPLTNLYLEALNKWKELNPAKFIEETDVHSDKVSASYIEYKERPPFPDLTTSWNKDILQQQREQYESYLRSVIQAGSINTTKRI